MTGPGDGRPSLSVTESAIQQVRELIVRGELRPGDRLPREADLAEQLGLSRSSLREAVRALSSMGLLEVRRGDGTYVTSLEPRALFEAVSIIADLSRGATALHLLEVRRVLEAEATARAAEMMTDTDVAALRVHVEALSEEPSLEELVAHDLELHLMIARCGGNPLLCSLLESVSGPTQRARIWRALTEEGSLERTRAEHRAIVDAIAAGQPEVARAWATAHVAGVEQWLQTELTGG